AGPADAGPADAGPADAGPADAGPAGARPTGAGSPGPGPPGAGRRVRPSCQPRCRADMVWRISAGVGPPGGTEGPAAAVSRRGGALRSWGCRFACLTRRGRPLTPPSASGPGPSGTAGIGPVCRDTSHGGPEGFWVRGEATGVIGV